MKLYAEIKKFIRFNVVGLVNTAVDFAIYTLLSALGMSIALSQVISYGAGMATSYALNSRWTFKDKSLSAKKIALFVAVNLIALGVSTAILYLCKNLWAIEGFFAKLIALPFSVVINFLGNRLFVFK